MPETAEPINELTPVSPEKDTWTLVLPAELCRREGFAEGTVACLTFKNGTVQASLVSPSEKARQAAKRFIGKYGDFMKEMEELGD